MAGVSGLGLAVLERAMLGRDDIEPGERALVEASRAGDRDAFSSLVRQHQGRVFRLAGRFFQRREDVEDAAQATFLAAWEKLASYRAAAPFEHWLTRLCLNTCYDRLRRERSTVELPDEIAGAGQTADERLEVERLLARLAPADRFVLLLLHGEEWSVEEIARRLGWSRANVKVRAHRARRKLRRWLEEGE